MPARQIDRHEVATHAHRFTGLSGRSALPGAHTSATRAGRLRSSPPVHPPIEWKRLPGGRLVPSWSDGGSVRSASRSAPILLRLLLLLLFMVACFAWGYQTGLQEMDDRWTGAAERSGWV